jgi:WD40 repeat protein
MQIVQQSSCRRRPMVLPMAALLCLACASRPSSQQQTAVTDRPEVQLSSFVGQIRGSQWSVDGRRIVVWSWKTAVVFDSNTGQGIFSTHAPSDKFFEAAGFSPDSHWLMLSNSGAEYPSVQIEQYALVTSDVPRRWPATAADSAWLFSKDGRNLIWLEPLGDNDDAKFAVNVSDVETHKTHLRVRLPAINSGVREIVQSPDGHWFAASGEEKISFVRLANGSLFEFDQTPEGSAIAFDLRGGRVAWLVLGGVAVWDGNTNVPKILRDTRCLRPEPSIPNANPGLFSPTEDLLAMPANDNRVCVWDLTARRVRAILPQASAPSEAGPTAGTPVAWSRAGRGLSMFDGNGTYYDWDIARRTPVITKIDAISKVAGEPVVLTTPVEEDFERHKLIVHSNSGNKREFPITGCFIGRSEGFDDLIFGADDWVVVRCSPQPAIVHLTDGSVRRPQLEHWDDLRFNASSKLLALESRFGITLYDIEHDRVHAQLLSEGGEDLNSSSNSDQDPYLEFATGSISLESRTFQKSHRWQVGILGPRLTLHVEEIETRICGLPAGGLVYQVGSHYAWATPSRATPGVLCDLASGREIGRLTRRGLGKVTAINSAGTVVVVTDLGGEYLWWPAQQDLWPLPSRHR